MLRGVRFAARFDLAIDPATLAAMRALAPKTALVSRERVRQIEVRAFEKVQQAVKAGVARIESLPPPNASQSAGAALSSH